MNLPPAVEKLTARFDAMSIRERVLVAGALLAALLMMWMLAVLDPIAGKQRALNAEKSSLEEQISAAKLGIESANANDPTVLALAKEKKQQTTLDDINSQLASTSAGLIPPERMVQVIHDVLSRQHGVSLVSLHNKTVTSLVQSTASAPTTNTQPDGTQIGIVEDTASGPFVHPVEIVVEGSYLDVLAYLQALENLDWRFYWKVLDLETKRYPVNRVRIELSTLSMDTDWIGV
jgi:MSHA biogenesis protein MshJ